jgi:hypothetical protein
MTGMFLQTSCSMTKARNAYPDINGNSTSVNMRSMLWGLSFKVSHAINPSGTAETAQREKHTSSVEDHDTEN